MNSLNENTIKETEFKKNQVEILEMTSSTNKLKK